ncbi:nucleoside 2-deoxyribosyltransferase [Streptoalloteichus hindustanus]|uniref:Nucleoside 2-deoxyribosyltransferase n=1 Tax=Streptoalloteichus hindustanus TaxID=2017 RepID=A0A1M5CVC1_STRHI|nr:nucleoside 2-deoxyribosyltransferase [Streptoalloteichus hindustanus]SHF58711.1 Nucleoside 2-deoxyribosyltransferase [Streptoalloteichus hindustanus]
MHQDFRVFLAAPFAQWLSADGVVDSRARRGLTALRQTFLNLGLPVFSAHHNERWGQGWLPPETCVPSDFRAMQTADVVCAYLGTPPSGGVCLELGWASAMHKPVLLVLDDGARPSQMIEGLATVTPVRRLVVTDGLTEETAREIVDATVALAGDCSPQQRTAWRADALDASLGYVRAIQVAQTSELLGDSCG